jgi:hypothetical protein
MVAITHNRVPGATVVVGDAVPLPFDDGAFGRVFSSHLYGHLLPAERDALLVRGSGLRQRTRRQPGNATAELCGCIRIYTHTAAKNDA